MGCTPNITGKAAALTISPGVTYFFKWLKEIFPGAWIQILIYHIYQGFCAQCSFCAQGFHLPHPHSMQNHNPFPQVSFCRPAIRAERSFREGKVKDKGGRQLQMATRKDEEAKKSLTDRIFFIKDKPDSIVQGLPKRIKEVTFPLF